ncbi:hypothetical protein ElyMa_003616300 [Elysia marginata]|uniref:Uncharacterized protein n=1 Tax=Elysia marginata TaxID=1093978 RepID=A0AAV4ERQ5_9GAST|nr:hypothetical protein ElyMa_003616300 [Elysia marginata]
MCVTSLSQGLNHGSFDPKAERLPGDHNATQTQRLNSSPDKTSDRSTKKDGCSSVLVVVPTQLDNTKQVFDYKSVNFKFG